MTDDNVIKPRWLAPDEFMIPPNQVLNRAADYNLTQVVVVGRKPGTNEVYLAGSHGAPITSHLLLRGIADLMALEQIEEQQNDEIKPDTE